MAAQESLRAGGIYGYKCFVLYQLVIQGKAVSAGHPLTRTGNTPLTGPDGKTAARFRRRCGRRYVARSTIEDYA